MKPASYIDVIPCEEEAQVGLCHTDVIQSEEEAQVGVGGVQSQILWRNPGI